MGENILIVDDSASMRQMVNFTLTESGYTVIEATNGQDGLNKLNETDNLKLVVSDIHMPIMDGINFIKNVRAGAKHKFVPIIILTTESEQNMQNEGKKAGASAWIVKPFTPEQLIDTVKKIAK